MKQTKKITILHSNDLHGDFLAEQVDEKLVGGVSMLSGYIEKVRAEQPNTIYAIAGDMFRGSVIDSEYKGLSTIEIMNALAPDVVTIGNHEVDYGIAHLLFIEKCARFPIINANLYIKNTSTRLFDGLMYLVVILAGGLSLVYGKITAGDMVAYMLYVTTLIATIRRIVEFAEQFQRGMTGIERFAEIMDTPVAIKDAPDAVPLQPGPGEIRFEKVCFEYPDDHNKVLHDVSLDIRAGERLALVGASGGGKTTLCNLIPRFYEVTSGRILIDGQDIRHVTLKSLRQDIGIVQQDVYLFSGTVAQNIAYGKPGATRQEIEAAARLAGAEKFILALKDGYDTYVGERGVKLSGGQKQRIAIARVFLKNPPILILDEATSALDNESEILVGQSLEKLAHGRTTLTIAHRLTTIKDYDRILVLGEEGIVEQGTHAQLLEKQGVYYRLWNQLPAEDEE